MSELGESQNLTKTTGSEKLMNALAKEDGLN